jgi:hypothetical protein
VLAPSELGLRKGKQCLRGGSATTRPPTVWCRSKSSVCLRAPARLGFCPLHEPRSQLLDSAVGAALRVRWPCRPPHPPSWCQIPS